MVESAPGGLLVNDGVEQSPTHFDSLNQVQDRSRYIWKFGYRQSDKAQPWSSRLCVLFSIELNPQIFDISRSQCRVDTAHYFIGLTVDNRQALLHTCIC